jgi:hypothetical protein
MTRYGLPDPQDVKAMATCASCGMEIYEGETVYVIEGAIIHENSDCLLNFVAHETMSIEEALGR